MTGGSPPFVMSPRSLPFETLARCADSLLRTGGRAAAVSKGQAGVGPSPSG